MDFKKIIDDGKKYENSIQSYLNILKTIGGIVLCVVAIYFINKNTGTDKFIYFIAIGLVALSLVIESLIFRKKRRNDDVSVGYNRNYNNSDLDNKIAEIRATELAKQKLKK